MPIEQILNILRQTPGRFSGLTAGVGPTRLREIPEPGEWSANEVLAHLRSCADVWGAAINAILAESHPTLKAINPIAWIETTDYCELEFHSSLQAFTKQRFRLLDVLEALPSGGWSRHATVVGAGKPLERTVQTYADWLARHERSHWKQMERTVASVLE
jgi:hypothetical protein